MPEIVDDGQNGYALLDDSGDAWEIMEEDGYPFIVYDDRAIFLDPDAVEQAVQLADEGAYAEYQGGVYEEDGTEGYDPGDEAEQAWLGWLNRQLVSLDQSLGRKLTDEEVRTLHDAAANHHEATPDVGALFDSKFPGRRDSQDSNARRETIQEIAQESMDREAEKEQLSVGWDDDAAADESGEE